MYESDKVQSGLLVRYEERFAQLRDVPVRYLEVGIWRGGSLRWAADFFRHPESRITGVDLLVAPVFDEPRIQQFHADQRDPSGLRRIGQMAGPFDIVIDDASHLPAETQATFEALWPHVRSGGWYVIEDWCAPFSHGPIYNGIELVVTEIARQKPRHGIAEMAILAYGNNSSHAFYRKA